MSFLSELPSQRIIVIGAGVTGEALLTFLKTRGVEEITLLDEKAKQVSGARLISELDQANFDLAIVSP